MKEDLQKGRDKTTIWKLEGDKDVQIASLGGFPCGVPRLGAVVRLPKYGMARCSGTSESGSGGSRRVYEVKLTIMDQST